jgi:hypothetical protein
MMILIIDAMTMMRHETETTRDETIQIQHPYIQLYVLLFIRNFSNVYILFRQNRI